ncbi:MAG: SidJ-related pseudokinase [Desulfobacter sp.]|nr:MAG: SidJ-related pseudokinase [Desulfobacter sp.]
MGMLPPNKTGRIDTENFLAGPVRDFSAAYMAVKYLADHIRNHPETITGTTIEVLAGVIESSRFQKQKQVLFLYGEAADAMVSMAILPQFPVSAPIIPRLLAMLDRAQGKRLRAVSQALGRLPVSFTQELALPGPDTDAPEPAMEIDFDTLAGALACRREVSFAWKGRSLALKTGQTILGIIKFAHSPENIRELLSEAIWMEQLNDSLPQPGVALPRPFQLRGRLLFKLSGNLPPGGPASIKKGICIAFIPCPGYYDYPNHHPERFTPDLLKAIFFKNAEFLGRLSRAGVFHTALIPLFHNRVQRNRRNDNGAYLWEHGGRLDQWLDSCRFPNFAASGPRDFEHLDATAASSGSGKLRHYIGEHLLSFILVIGSCFRNKAPARRGRDGDNRPCDTRDLFHLPLFSELVNGVCRAYFKGLVDRPCPPDTLLAPRNLIQALISAMGKDEHMEEVLRVRDQEVMDDAAFKTFLTERGLNPDMEKGLADIVLETGPHLGGFNRPISVPMLIDQLFRFSAFCTAHCYLEGRQQAGADALPDQQPVSRVDHLFV